MDKETRDLLKRMHTVSIDLETTGVKPSDQVWSGGFYSIKDGVVLDKKEDFFNIKGETYNSNTSVGDLQDILEQAHSSRSFGERQAGKIADSDGVKVNVLSDWARAVSEKRATTVGSFINSLGDTLDHKGGSILLLQNVNFEDRVLSHLHGKGNLPEFSSITEKLLDKGLPASTNPSFGEPFERYLLPRQIYDERLLQNAYLKETLTAYGGGLDYTDALSKYKNQSMKIVDKYMENMKRASKEGKVAVMDLMDFTKAIYAHGAISGQVKPEHLTFGAKVETLSKALLGEKELHSSLSDSIHQQKLFDILTEELHTISKEGSSYQSPIVSKLVDQIEKDKLFSTQLKERPLSVIREYLEGSPNPSLIGLNKELEDRFSKSNRHLNNITKEDFNLSDYYSKLKDKASGYFEADGSFKGKAEDVLSDLEGFASEYKYTTQDKLASMVDESKLSRFMKNKYVKGGLAVGGGAFIASMMFGGDSNKQKEVKYNTYDELYNNQYYGSQFADWENRNNSHKMQ